MGDWQLLRDDRWGWATDDLFNAVVDEATRAPVNFPRWPVDIVPATALMMEEAGKVVRAANNVQWQHEPGAW